MLRLLITSNKHGNTYLDFNSQEEIDAYINQNEQTGHWGKISENTVSYQIIPSPVIQENINKEALKYLSETDWYVTRFAETGIEIPQNIKDLRQAARNSIVR